MASVPAVIYLVSGYFITGGTDAITAGTVVAFTTVQARLLMPLMGLMRVALDLQTSTALFARIFEYLDLDAGDQDAPDAISVARRPAPSDASSSATSFSGIRMPRPTPAPTLAGRLVHRRAGTARRVRRALRARARRPSCTSRRGCTRHPAARCCSRARTCVDLTQESIIDEVGIVSQETYLFHATIGENLRYAKPGATEDELVVACRAANIHHIIDELRARLRHRRG